MITCLLTALAAAGCTFSSAPPRNIAFATVTDLHQLQGRYRNRGLGGAEEMPMFLSGLIWPADSALDHTSIDAIDVDAPSASTLTVRAIDAQSTVVKESTFVEGRDFELEAGRLRIKRRGALLGEAPDDPLVGPRMEEVELGIDLRGHGKYRSTFTAAGLVYLLVPVAVHGAQEVRFERIDGGETRTNDPIPRSGDSRCRAYLRSGSHESGGRG